MGKFIAHMGVEICEGYKELKFFFWENRSGPLALLKREK